MTESQIPPEECENPFREYALNGDIEKLRSYAQDQIPLLGGLAVKGQVGVWYAAPNLGKTLAAINLLTADILAGRLKGKDCYYIAADDSAFGVVEKLVILAKLDVQVLAPGFQAFSASMLPGLMGESIATGTAKRRFLILDTLKKFTNLMDKADSSKFASQARQFTLHGGTLLGLAHTNKRTDQDGNPVFAGTSDIRDDFDYVFTLKPVPSMVPGQRFIQADCIKGRGCVVQQALLSYSDDRTLPYPDLVNSLRVLSSEEQLKLTRDLDLSRDAEAIAAIARQISAGGKGKMAIAKEVARELGIGRNTVDALIDKYTGLRPDTHCWAYEVKGRGLREYRLLEGSVALSHAEPEPVF